MENQSKGGKIKYYFNSVQTLKMAFTFTLLIQPSYWFNMVKFNINIFIIVFE